MKRIINGFRYDTEKADLIASASYGNAGDFEAWYEALYKTPRSGRFFLYGEGGPMSKYGRATGQNSWSGGEKITPLSPKQALEWCEQRDIDPEEYERFFEDMITDA